jgi:alkylated DNA repair dioxygenase AlkB
MSQTHAIHQQGEEKMLGLVPKRLAMTEADVILYPSFFAAAQADTLFQELQDGTPWRQEQIKLYGKPIRLPRLTAWHGDEGKSYSYSGITVQPAPWTATLLTIKSAIEPVAGVTFNSVLLNLYRGQRDSVSWHSDDEPELGINPVIGSVSLGSTRVFQFRHKKRKGLRMSLELCHGSFLLMKGPTQHHWLHQVPKVSATRGPRINLTFRVIQ